MVKNNLYQKSCDLTTIVLYQDDMSLAFSHFYFWQHFYLSICSCGNTSQASLHALCKLANILMLFQTRVHHLLRQFLSNLRQ